MLVSKALQFAAERHGDQKYGEFPYLLHLATVQSILFQYHAPTIVVAAGVLHDVLEDTETTFEEVNERFGGHVANLVLAVTNPKEGTRKEKHEIQYPKIKAAGNYAIMIKLADRIANVESGGKTTMYMKEHSFFFESLYEHKNTVLDGSDIVQTMWKHLERSLQEQGYRGIMHFIKEGVDKPRHIE